jgi:hypothetical protein
MAAGFAVEPIELQAHIMPMSPAPAATVQLFRKMFIVSPFSVKTTHQFLSLNIVLLQVKPWNATILLQQARPG